MRRSLIERIKDSIRRRQYDMTAHAVEEMAEDELTIIDVEHAVLNGSMVRVQRDHPKGNRYAIEGMAPDDATAVAVVGRFPVPDRYLIITVYKVE